MKRLFSILLILLIWYPVHCYAAWEDAESRTKWCAIVIDKDEVDAALSDFAVLLDASVFLTNAPNMLDSDETDDCAQNGGGDLRFSSTEPTAADGTGATQIACEVVSFVTNSTPASATAEVQIPVASLSSVADTIVYCAWYTSSTSSQPAIDSTYGAENVWDSNFKMVQHMSDTTTSSITDSTDSNNDGTKKGAGEPVETTTAQIGEAQDFDGVDDYVSSASVTSLPSGREARTLSFWMNPDNSDPGGTVIALSNSNFFGQSFIFLLATFGGDIYIYTDGKNATNNITITGDQIPVVGQWSLISFVFDGVSGWTYYLNGAQKNSGSFAVTINTTADKIVIGRREDGGFTGIYFPGIIDEFKMSNTARSADWISTEYNNQNSPSTFAESGSIQTIGATTSNSQVIIVNFY